MLICSKFYRNFDQIGMVTRCFGLRVRASSDNQKRATGNANADIDWHNAKPLSSLPGPSKLGLIRSFLPGGTLYNLNVLEVNNEIYKKYGPILKFPSLFGKPELVFSFDPNDIESIMRNEGQWPIRRGLADSFEYYRKNVRPDIFKNIGGLVSDQGEVWSKLRSVSNPIMLKPKVVKAYIPDIDAVANDFIRKIRALQDDQSEMPYDFHNELNKWSLESIALVALEYRLNLITNQNDLENQKFIEAVKDFFTLSYELDILPSIWKYYKTAKFYRLMASLDVMTNISKKHIDEAIERLEKQNNKEYEASVLQKILRIDKHYAVVMALDMLMAGTETTAAVVSILLYNLATNQRVQNKLREEVMTILPNKYSPLTAASLNNLPYLRVCIKESMRIIPVVAGIPRTTARDIVLQGYQIPKGTDCVIGTGTLATNNNFVQRADEFIPERFLKHKDIPSGCPNANDIHPFIMIPFGFGPRTCIGRRFAEMIMEVFVIRLLREFKVEWNYGPLKFANALTLTPSTNLKFKLTIV